MKKYNKEEKGKHLQAWNKSGLSQNGYAKQQGINPKTFNNWAKHATIENKQKAHFAEVVVKENKAENQVSPLQLVINAKYILKIEQNFDKKTLVRTLQTLEAL